MQTSFVAARVILDLCGGTGSWSRPYADAGYDVRVIDLQEWLDGRGSTGDVRMLRFLDVPRPVHGILMAPPCTDFAVSGARWWADKGPDALLTGLSVVDACLRIAMVHRPLWWALENPVGRLVHFLGEPAYTFDPCDHGDPYTKRTCLWGQFALPKRNPVAPTDGSKMHLLPPSSDRARLRSATPQGFARAFFEANP